MKWSLEELPLFRQVGLLPPNKLDHFIMKNKLKLSLEGVPSFKQFGLPHKLDHFIIKKINIVT